ncbi:hypothetical protein [Bacillus sp. UNC322MFChir4.1]|uniref:hypothetical protein n=1 Tax=Bacillus sp. UNC322MFChir4.1 TaxID=1449045 RepID=UPI00054ED56D|nr:hypothetical protein [Bacillus sp. UNC322MFChir4.1]
MSGNVTVLTYENPYNFHQKMEFQPYINCLHICATKSLETGVKQRMNLPNVKSSGAIIDLFYPEWNLPENRFIQYTQLSDLLRNWNDLCNPKVIRSFKRNKLNLLITMRNFTEIGLTPNDLRPNVTKVEEDLFCDLWEAMEPNFEVYMNEAAKNVENLEQIKDVFNKDEIQLTNNTVVLHGFYYISPVQHYLFTKWKELGVNIVFLNLYHTDYPSVFSFLDENFSEKYGWAKKEDWKITRDDETLNGILFASRFEGNENSMGNLKSVTEKPYEYMVEFVEDLQNEVSYVSPNNDRLKERIKEFCPDSFLEDRHFLAYPIGQYLFHLHSVWDEDRKDYFLTDKILMESFASGWLEIEGENARNYTAQLKAILPYFTNCSAVGEWMVQFQTLIDAKKASVQVFKKHDLKKNDFLEAVRISPVLRFSYFSVPLSVLKKLQQFLIKFVEDAGRLVNIKEERITIKTHFQRIQQLLNDSNLKSSLAGDIERMLVNQLEEMLTKPIKDEQSYHIGDLADSIIVFLKNGLENPDQTLIGSPDTHTSELYENLNHHEVEKDEGVKKPQLFKMADLDGLILRNDFEELHLCGMDELHFPETSAPMPWPLSFELITKLDNRSADMYVFRKKYSLAFSRYLFFLALSFSRKVCLSWVKNWGEYENLDKSIYIEIVNIESAGELEKDTYEYIAPKFTSNGVDLEMMQDRLGQLPQEEFAEMSLCKKRFFYSSIVDGFATYHSSFHQGFLIGNLVKIYASIGKTKPEIIDMLELMFPHMTNISLRTIIDQNMNEDFVSGMRKYGLGKRRKIAEIEYPESMLYFQFLTHRGAFENENWQSAFTPTSGIRRQKAEMIQQLASQTSVLAEANPSLFCKLCPHAGYCEDAYYAVDISKKGFDDNDMDTAEV